MRHELAWRVARLRRHVTLLTIRLLLVVGVPALDQGRLRVHRVRRGLVRAHAHRIVALPLLLILGVSHEIRYRRLLVVLARHVRLVHLIRRAHVLVGGSEVFARHLEVRHLTCAAFLLLRIQILLLLIW